VFLKDYKIWPVNGGMIEQNAKFIRAIEFIDMIKQRYFEIEQKEQEVKQRLLKMRNNG
jgi:hypothetical protein